MNIGGMGNRIPNYFWNVYWPWIIGDDSQRNIIEQQYLGVHEYLPSIRGASFTTQFDGTHPIPIETRRPLLENRLIQEMEYIRSKINMSRSQDRID